jgi:hypothetical protein
MGLSAIALGGLDQALSHFENAAKQVGAPADVSGAGPDTVDLSTAAVSMLSARNEFAANIAVVKIADEMERNVLNVLA